MMTPLPPEKAKLTGSQIGSGFAASVQALGVGVAIGTAIAGILKGSADDTVRRENSDIKRYDSIRAQAKGGDLEGARKRLAGSAKDDMVRWEGLGGKLDMGGAFLGSMFSGGANPLDEAKANAARRKLAQTELETAIANTSENSAGAMLSLKKAFDEGVKVEIEVTDGKVTGTKLKKGSSAGAAPSVNKRKAGQQ
jgi:hypothetical protein